MKLEHTNAIKDLTDEELDAAIAAVREMLDRRAAGGAVIEGTAETVALPPPAEVDRPQRKPNRLMMEADTAIGPREFRPRKPKVPSPASA